MTNELRRRLEVMGDNLPQQERDKVVDKYTQQLVNSGYSWKQCREIVISAIKGQVRKETMIKKLGIKKYRSGQESLNKRVNKKLLEKYNWFRTRKSDEDKENDKTDHDKENRRGYWHH